MSEHFCGNPFNHGAHTVEEPSGKSYRCDGVGRVEIKEEIVEKYEPSEMAGDGTPYVKISIFVEEKDGTTTIIEVDKAAYPELQVDYQKYHGFDRVTRFFNPEIERVEFAFRPFSIDDQSPAFTIERKKNDGN